MWYLNFEIINNNFKSVDLNGHSMNNGEDKRYNVAEPHLVEAKSE